MMHVGEIMSTVGDVQYRGGINFLLFEYPHGTEHPPPPPDSTHDIPHMYRDTQIIKDGIPPRY